MNFAEYLKTATDRALTEAKDLDSFVEVCRRGARRNWEEMTPARFLSEFHFGVATAGKKVRVLEKTYWTDQVALFRDHDADRIFADQDFIRAEWRQRKRYLRPEAVEAVIFTAQLVRLSWQGFRRVNLPLPANPETESLWEWSAAHAALDRLPRVGPAVAWFLIRNLYGARVFKPDVHILAIANHYFPQAANPLRVMTEAVKDVWPTVCTDERLLPLHLGKVDFILWWYRSETGLPEARVAVAC